MEPSPKIGIEVIERFKAGDKKAFEEIVLCYQKRVFNIAYRILGNLEEAKDSAQEVFVSVFDSIMHLREEIKFDVWLTQITLNHCRNRWKYLKRRHYFDSDSLDDPVETEDGDIMPRQIEDPTENPEMFYEKKMVSQFVQNGLFQLKEEQRELIVLRDLQGYSYGEIGRLFHLPEGTVKSKLHRARMDLKEILEKSMH
jgi:RNA polymerase sigma-70 factor (ECF subfamily)